MAGIDHDFFGAAPVAPGDGRQRELGRILDRDDNIYGNNVYLYLTDNSRVDLRTIIENPPGGGPTVVTAPNPLPNNEIILGAGSQTIKTSGITFPTGSPTAGQIITAVNGTSLQWSNVSASAVTTVASGGGSGDSLVISGGPGAVTLKDILAGTGIAVVSDADDVRIDNAGVTSVTAGTGISLSGGTGAVTITNAGVTSLAGTGTGDQNLVVGGPTGSVTIKRLTAGGGTSLTSDANQITITAAGITGNGADNHVVRWDGTTAVQNSGTVLDDSDNLTLLNSVNSLTNSNLTGVTDDFVAACRVNVGSSISAAGGVGNSFIGVDLQGSSSITSTNQDCNSVHATLIRSAGSVVFNGDYSSVISCDINGVSATTTIETADHCLAAACTLGAGLSFTTPRGVAIGTNVSTNALTIGGTGTNGAYSSSYNSSSSSAFNGTAGAVIGASIGSAPLAMAGTGTVVAGFFGNSATNSSTAGSGQAILGCSGYASCGTSAANAVIGCTNGAVGNFSQSVVIASTSTANGQALTLCGGSGAGSASTANRKWMIDSADGGYYSAKAPGSYGAVGAAFEAMHTFPDFAERFAHVDQTQELGYGLILAEKGGKVLPADTSKGHVIGDVVGIRSVAPAYCAGDNFAHWPGRYLTDKWGLVINDDLTEEEAKALEDVDPAAARSRKRPRENPEWDRDREWVPRKMRKKEWSEVGLMGQMLTRVDKTITEEGQYVTISANPGVGTLSQKETKIKVMRISTPYDEAEGYAIALCRLNC